jgi:hypothetical protein
LLAMRWLWFLLVGCKRSVCRSRYLIFGNGSILSILRGVPRGGEDVPYLHLPGLRLGNYDKPRFSYLRLSRPPLSINFRHRELASLKLPAPSAPLPPRIQPPAPRHPLHSTQRLA